MSKQEFLAQLRKGLSGLPQDDVEERLTFYGEMIEDQIEEGRSEEEAVSAVGSVDEIVAQAVEEIPFAKIAKERMRAKRRLSAGEILLLVLGSPIWLSLAVAAFAVILSLYAVLWSVIVSVWAAFISLIAFVLGGAAAAVIFAVKGSGLTGIAMIGASLFCAGLAIFLFFGCKAATKGTLVLTQKIVLSIKKCFVKKECV